jgi:hypothetical protein
MKPDDDLTFGRTGNECPVARRKPVFASWPNVASRQPVFLPPCSVAFVRPDVLLYCALLGDCGSTFGSVTMEPPLVEWPRRHYLPGGKDPFLFYAVYGRIDTTKALSRAKYRSNGIPDGIDVMVYGPTAPTQVAGFRDGYLWDQLTSGMKCRRKGSEEDPDFNNEHIEILWPTSAEARA